MSPCYRAWIMKAEVLWLWCLRLPYDHMFLAAFLRFNYQQDRIMRLGQLLAVIFVGMFAAAFFYSVSGADYSGVDADCDGVDDFVPLELWEQALFAIISSILQLPASVLLTVLFGMAGNACFVWRYFPIWRELELRKVAEVHLGSKVGELRRRLQVLQTSLANWLETTNDHVGVEDVEQLRMVCELLGDEDGDELIDQVLDGRTSLGNERMSAVQMRSQGMAAAESQETDGVVAADPSRSRGRSLRKERSLQAMAHRTHRTSLRLLLVRALRDYGDFMAAVSRSELSCLGYVWSWRCADACGCLPSAWTETKVAHERCVATLAAKLAATKPEGVDKDQKMAVGLAKRALQDMQERSGQPTVFWFLPVQVLPDVFNPAALGWVKAPRTCQICCPCAVWCCNRMPSQKPLFLVQQMAADGRPYGCCHTRRDARSDPTKSWMQVVRSDEAQNPPLPVRVVEGQLVSEGGDDADTSAAATRASIISSSQTDGAADPSAPIPIIQPSKQIRPPIPQYTSCSVCDCCECGPLDSLRCVCTIVRPAIRGTQDIAADQAGTRADGLLARIQAEGKTGFMLGGAALDLVGPSSGRRGPKAASTPAIPKKRAPALEVDAVKVRIDGIYRQHEEDAHAVQQDPAASPTASEELDIPTYYRHTGTGKSRRRSSLTGAGTGFVHPLDVPSIGGSTNDYEAG